MNTHDTLLAYSEWLDGQGLFRGAPDNDQRTHGELVSQFVAWWESVDARASLAGTEPLLGTATTLELVDELQARAHVAQHSEDWPHYRTVDS